MKNYFYISQEVLDAFPEIKVSKPILDHRGDRSYVGIIEDWNKIEEYYAREDCPVGFFAYELVDSQVSLVFESIDYDEDDEEIITKETLSSNYCKENGLLKSIELELGITKEQNIAYTLFKMAEAEGLNPIDLINKIVS